VDGRLHRSLHLLAVLRVEEPEVVLERGLEVPRPEAEDPVELVGPRDLVGGDVPAPAPDAGDLLRLPELLFARAELGLGLALLGDVAEGEDDGSGSPFARGAPLV